MNAPPTVFVLDDDASIVRAVDRLLCIAGFATRTWTSVSAFLAEHNPDEPGCLLTDLMMPVMNGLELQEHLHSNGCSRPIIFITARDDMNAAVQGMRAGAVTFLSKPITRHQLISAVEEALAKDVMVRIVQAEDHHIRQRLATLTTRELQVLHLVRCGRLNKQIAAALGTAEKTIKVHRGRVMKKMQVKSAAELAQLLLRINHASL